MTKMLVLWMALAGLAGQTRIPEGSDSFEATAGPQDAPIEVFTYKPAAFCDGPLIIVCHGVLRNASVYRDHAREMGDRLGAVIAVPCFDKERFPIESYQQGGILREGKTLPRSEWTFNRIPEIVAEIRRREVRPDWHWYLIGHSAGGQFVERLTAFLDSGATRVVAANPGTHLVPTRDQPYPFGFGGLPAELSDDAALRRYLAQPLTLYLGTADTQIDQYLTVGPQADAQGAFRLERGRRTFEFARNLARERSWAFHWRLVEAEDVKHDHTRMFNHAQAAAALFQPNPVHIVGHRGLLREAPENTLANFRACLELRLGFEFDVRRTRDGHLVCLHDETVDRTTDGQGKIAELTLDEVRGLDAGRWFSREFSGERIPTIDEILGLLAAHHEADVLAAVDIKIADGDVERDLVRLARAHNVLDRLVFIGRSIEEPGVRQRLKEADAGARVARLAGNPAEFERALAEADGDWLYVRFVPRGAGLRRAQAAGKRVFLSGPIVAGREPATWNAAAAAGVDAILTDFPLDLRREMAGTRSVEK
jgi:glycerophosphoryl diester phosphodiesterase